jgi:pimeloyl-ACP methyl ester carboxylesterase
MDLRPSLVSVRMPVLVIVGALDAATPPALGRALADGVTGARFVEIPDCGHCPPLEAPDTLLALIEPFLAGRP